MNPGVRKILEKKTNSGVRLKPRARMNPEAKMNPGVRMIPGVGESLGKHK